jgi:hypothetical protein
MKVVLVHGFNVKNKGKTTVDTLAPFIKHAGYDVDVDEGDYGFFNIWMVRFKRSRLRKRVIFRLAQAFIKADVIITHSNGANFATQALDMLSPEYNNSKIVIHISAALDTDADVPMAVKKQLVMYTPHDKAVRLSSYLLFHPWGRMGAKGYKGNDNRVENLLNHDVNAHSDWFTKQHVKQTWFACNAFLRKPT